MAPPDDLRSSNQDGGRASCLDRQARASELYYEDFPELRPEAQTARGSSAAATAAAAAGAAGAGPTAPNVQMQR